MKDKYLYLFISLILAFIVISGVFTWIGLTTNQEVILGIKYSYWGAIAFVGLFSLIILLLLSMTETDGSETMKTYTIPITCNTLGKILAISGFILLPIPLFVWFDAIWMHMGSSMLIFPWSLFLGLLAGDMVLSLIYLENRGKLPHIKCKCDEQQNPKGVEQK